MKYRALLTAIIIAASISMAVGTVVAQGDLNQAYARAKVPGCHITGPPLAYPCNPLILNQIPEEWR
jgi:hypothetical protein